MIFNPQFHHRRATRLEGHDYSQEGVYFITTCTNERECYFGGIKAGELILNDIGKIAENFLQKIPAHFPHVELGEFIVMPNHVHLILILRGSPVGASAVGARHVVPLPTDPDYPVGASYMMPQQMPRQNQFSKPIAGSVSVIMQQYKSSVKRWCNKNDHRYFQWQSRFYDHIIRDNESFRNITNYIKANPTNWNEDNFYTG